MLILLNKKVMFHNNQPCDDLPVDIKYNHEKTMDLFKLNCEVYKSNFNIIPVIVNTDYIKTVTACFDSSFDNYAEYYYKGANSCIKMNNGNELFVIEPVDNIAVKMNAS